MKLIAQINDINNVKRTRSKGKEGKKKVASDLGEVALVGVYCLPVVINLAMQSQMREVRVQIGCGRKKGRVVKLYRGSFQVQSDGSKLV